MRAAEVVIQNPSGLHARPAALFVRTAAAYRSTVRVRNVTRNGAAVDAKSILGVLGLGVAPGHRIAIEADGDDEAVAIDALLGLVEAGIGEELAG